MALRTLLANSVVTLFLPAGIDRSLLEVELEQLVPGHADHQAEVHEEMEGVDQLALVGSDVDVTAGRPGLPAYLSESLVKLVLESQDVPPNELDGLILRQRAGVRAVRLDLKRPLSCEGVVEGCGFRQAGRRGSHSGPPCSCR